MPFQPECMEKHRNKDHLECNLCSENHDFTITLLKDIDELSEKIIASAGKFPEWFPHYARMAYAITLVVHEACMNAVEHGILGLDKESKKKRMVELEGEYPAWVEAEWKRKNIPIYISLCLNAERILIGVHDGGRGFDFTSKNFSTISDTEMLDPSGRGLKIMGGMGVNLQWNRCGNSVLCSYRRPGS